MPAWTWHANRSLYYMIHEQNKMEYLNLPLCSNPEWGQSIPCWYAYQGSGHHGEVGDWSSDFLCATAETLEIGEPPVPDLKRVHHLYLIWKGHPEDCNPPIPSHSHISQLVPPEYWGNLRRDKIGTQTGVIFVLPLNYFVASFCTMHKPKNLCVCWNLVDVLARA